MGVPTIGGQITGAVTEDSGLIISGDLNDVGAGTGNNDDVWSISAGPSFGVATINPATGLWTYDLDDTNPVVNALAPGATMTDVFTVLMVDADGRIDTQVITITITGAPCFVAGTPIETEKGPIAVEDLRPGDLVRTLDHGLQPVRWIGMRCLSEQELTANPQLRPVRIAAGALGPLCPSRDIFLSPQHRILLATPRCQAILGVPEVLVAALKLCGVAGIDRTVISGPVTYYHLLLDRHELLFSAGAVSESLWAGADVDSLFGLDGAAMAILPAGDEKVEFARPVVEDARLIRNLLAQTDLPLQQISADVI